MQTQVKRGRGRPKGSVPKKLQPVTPLQNFPCEDEAGEAELNEKELKFLELYLSGQCSKEVSMDLAGYKNKHRQSAEKTADRILRKYDLAGEDHRKTFRLVGLTERRIAEGILELAKNAKSEMVRLNAWALAAKCLGLQKEVVEGVQGIQIIIKGRDEARKPVPGGGRPGMVNREHSAALPVPPKTLMITR